MKRDRSWREAAMRTAILAVGAVLGAGAERLLAKDVRPAVVGAEFRREDCPGAARLVTDGPDDRACPCYLVSRTQVDSLIDAIESMGRAVSPPPPQCTQYEEQDEMLWSLLSEQDELEGRLVEHLREGNPHRTRKAAAFLLGHFQMAKAVEPLLDCLDLYPEDWCPSSHNHSLLYDACSRAVGKIGKPAVEPIIRRLGLPASEMSRQLEIRILRSLEGKEMAVRKLQFYRDLETDAEKRRRLEDAIVRLPTEP
jgi:hypothetical protein